MIFAQFLVYYLEYSVVINILVFVLQLFMFISLGLFYHRSKKTDISVPQYLYVMSYIVSALIVVSMAPIYNHVQAKKLDNNISLMNESHIPLTYYVMTAFTSSGISFRLFLILVFLNVIIEFSGGFYFVFKGEIDIQMFIFHSIVDVLMAIFFIFLSYNREMRLRKDYNRGRIIDVE